MSLTIESLTKRRLKELYYNNFSYQQIADLYGCTVGCIGKRVNKLIKEGYLVKRTPISRLVISEEERNPFYDKDIDTGLIEEIKISREEIIQMYDSGITMEKIAKKLRCSYQLIVKNVSEYNQQRGEHIPFVYKDIIDYIIELYQNNISYETIRKILSVDNSVPYRLIKSSIESGIIEKRKYIKKPGKIQKKVIEMYRGHYSITLISEAINRNFKDTDKIINNLISNGIMKKRDTSNKNANFLKMRKDKDIVINMYKYNITIENIADYYEVTQKDMKLFIDSLLQVQNIVIEEDTIHDMIFNKRKRPKEISEELNIPIKSVYKYIIQFE